MGQKTVLITGATGFIGSHIAQLFADNGFAIIATRRPTSNTWRCQAINNNITWLEIDRDDWVDDAITLQPSYIIHAAWEGVDANSRESLSNQLHNLVFLGQVLTVAAQVKPLSFVGLGSQAEYGIINGTINETAVPKPVSAYGMAKLLALQTIEWFCTLQGIPWFWGRVFSCFGEMDNDSWLIPSLISSALDRKPMELTKCEQRYDFMHVRDLARMVLNVTQTNHFAPGVYNLSTGKALALRSVVDMIGSMTNASDQFKVGVKPYRENQSMVMQGDSSKYTAAFGAPHFVDMATALEATIHYYKSLRSHHESI